MTHLQEVPTDELLSFHDYPTVHSAASAGNNTTIPISESQIKVNDLSGNFQQSPNSQGAGDAPNIAGDAGL